ncbi:alpha/beta-hydrolase [Pholiota conissans]|uniref:Alpha/beta-hydrolase n=1 Tax=Pholiota conissans TaxID=109636 RepID=A0A9P5YL93_9AGAR|nr:alpha/beta-hydrolase [Pholiota conissans]
MSNTTPNWPNLPPIVVSRTVAANDLDIHILEALPPSSDPNSKPPLIVLVHGFPEIAYSWRKIMAPLAAQGYAVVALDQRGFGQTKERGKPIRRVKYEDDLSPYRILNIAADVVALVYALGYTSVVTLVGHDYGSHVAAHCALIRPDLFKSVVLMSAPYEGPPSLSAVQNPNGPSLMRMFNDQLAMLDPPRKHYMMYCSTPEANDDMINPPGGLHNFLRTYYHVKSADWKGNGNVRPLPQMSPAVLAELPPYYVMPLAETMPECLAPDAPSAEEIANNKWLTDDELAVYVSQYTATGFQSSLNAYRVMTDPPRWAKDLHIFTGKQIEVPAMFLAGVEDWGTYQAPGFVEKMRTQVCRDMKDENFVLIDGAGHWVQQEQPEAVVEQILRFIRTAVVPSV